MKSRNLLVVYILYKRREEAEPKQIEQAVDLFVLLILVVLVLFLLVGCFGMTTTAAVQRVRLLIVIYIQKSLIFQQEHQIVSVVSSFSRILVQTGTYILTTKTAIGSLMLNSADEFIAWRVPH